MRSSKRLNPDSVFQYVKDRHAGLVRDWFAELRVGGLDRGELVVQAANHDQAVYLERYCRPAFVDGAQAATGRLVGVRFAYRNGGQSLHDVEAAADEPLLRLNAEYTFDRFVVGPCNRLAHAAAIATIEAPGRIYNPLFIHGTPGAGKTHLVQAVCHRILDLNPRTRVAYLSCELFASDYVEAVASDAVHRFQDRYRHADLLIVDDVQMLAPRVRSQDEFFHTFNSLHQEQRQIILTADRPPDAIAGLQERLTSRFKWGLVVEVELPCVDTRAAMVSKRAKLRGMEMGDDVVMLIAEEIPRSPRELEGALAKLQNQSQSSGGPITLELARETLGVAQRRANPIVPLRSILRTVAARHGLRKHELTGPSRSKSVALPRQISMYLARRLTKHSLHEIGKQMGHRDHTTVLHAERAIGERAASDPEMRGLLDELERELVRE